jgi:NAD(P)-dependent dehydrogenase (short-subunit alcohol dehydrogenase family)
MQAHEPRQHLFDEALGRAPGRGRLAGRRILVVGAGQSPGALEGAIGNGRAMAMLFAREGAWVACADRSLSAARETVALIAEEGGTAVAIEGDVGDEASVRRMVDGAAEGGDLDGLVLNVGINSKKALPDVGADHWDEVFRVNIRGHMLVCRDAWPRLAEGSSVVLISSMGGVRASGNNVAYDAAKAALPGLCRHIVELGEPRGIRCNVLALGWMNTAMGQASRVISTARATRRMPFHRQGTGWETAYAALFLVSRESSFYNGQTMELDAGHRAALWS